MGAHFDPEELKDIKPGPIAWMASHPVAANLAMLVLIIGGFLVMMNSKQEVFPEFSFDTVAITMIYPGASPEEVEQGILLAIEDALKDIEGISDFTAQALEGYGHVMAEIDDEDETLRILQDIKTAVDQITTFPVDAENLTVSLIKNEEIVLDLVLHGTVSPFVLRQTAEMVRDRLEQHQDISLVDFPAVQDYQIHIEVPQANLRRYNLSIPDIAQIISRTSIELGGGAIKTSSGEVLVRMTERRNYANEFHDIPIITNPNGATVTLGQIATISDTFEDSNQWARFNDNPAIKMEISTTANQTPTQVTAAAREVLETLNNELPDGVALSITRDSSIMFKERAALLVNNGLFGLVLVVIFLALFLDIRLAFWVSMGIPISYMGAFLLTPLGDYFSINMVSMFAFIIALGIVVDDAVVVGENIYHKREQGMKPLKASVEGAREMAIPVTVSVLTNIVAFLPMLFMPGFMGKIFAMIPIIVISTFLLSLFESLFILPAHLTFKQSKNMKNRAMINIVGLQKGFNRRFDRFIKNRYAPFLQKTLSLRYISLSVFLFILMAMGGYVGGGHLGMQIFPRIESDFSVAQATLKVGAPRAEIEAVENRLLDSAAIVTADNGGEALSIGVYSEINENKISVFAYLTDSETRPISTEKYTALWRAQTGDIAGLETLTFASDFGGPGAGAALTVELSHSNTDTLDKAAVALAEALATFSNTRDIDDGSAQGKRQFDFTVNELGYTLGLTPADIGRQVRGAYYGSEAVKQQRGRNEVRTLVLLPEDERKSSYHFGNLMIQTPSGQSVLVHDVVEFTEGRAFTAINRRDSKRVVTVSSDVNPPSDANKVISTLKSDILPQLQAQYAGLSYSFEGEQADMRESLQSLMVGMFAILFVMYAMLAILFSSYSQPLLILIAIPFSMVGAVIGHFIMGFPLSMPSMFGIIALAGVVINDSLILIDMANKKRKEHNTAVDAVIAAARQRFRPIMLTTLTTFVGLAPMMFETSQQAMFLVPMAVSLGYGIVFATFLTLFLIPSLYLINEDIKRGAARVKGVVFG